MIAIALIIAAILITTLAVFWKEICKWIKKAAEKIAEVLKVVVKGVRTFIERTREGLQNKAKHYNENELTGEWEENVYTKKVNESEVPDYIMAKVRIQQTIGIEISGCGV